MARASVVTKLPLDTWAKIMGLHPLHFNQVRLANVDPHCDKIYFQHEWQNADHVSRESIAYAIKEAEDNIELALGYRLAPSWEVDEWRGTTRPYRPDLLNISITDVRGYRQTVQAKWGHFISGGIQAKTLIQAARPIVYTDVDTDLYFETATVTVVTSVVDPDEIAIFYPGKSGDDAWEIRPTTVSISGGTATITFRREQAIIASLLDVLDTEDSEALGTDDADFLTTVDVYRRYNDPQTQASFLWEPISSGTCSTCGGEGCPVCSYNTQTGCLVLRGDPRQSIVGFYPASWVVADLDFTAEAWNVQRQPDIVRLYYLAGWRDKRQTYTTRLDLMWERAIAYYAAALLDRPPCDCVADLWRQWREDLTIYQGDEDGKGFYRQPEGVLDNPFGTRRGMVNAWRRVKAAEPIAKAIPTI